jgi:hypothetical protein
MIFRTSIEIAPAALYAVLPLLLVVAIVVAPSARSTLVQLWVLMNDGEGKAGRPGGS